MKRSQNNPCRFPNIYEKCGLGDDGTRDRIASHVARPSCYHNVTDSRKATDVIACKRKKLNTNKNFKERGFLPDLKVKVSASSIR